MPRRKLYDVDHAPERIASIKTRCAAAKHFHGAYRFPGKMPPVNPSPKRIIQWNAIFRDKSTAGPAGAYSSQGNSLGGGIGGAATGAAKQGKARNLTQHIIDGSGGGRRNLLAGKHAHALRRLTQDGFRAVGSDIDFLGKCSWLKSDFDSMLLRPKRLLKRSKARGINTHRQLSRRDRLEQKAAVLIGHDGFLEAVACERNLGAHSHGPTLIAHCSTHRVRTSLCKSERVQTHDQNYCRNFRFQHWSPDLESGYATTTTACPMVSF